MKFGFRLLVAVTVAGGAACSGGTADPAPGTGGVPGGGSGGSATGSGGAGSGGASTVGSGGTTVTGTGGTTTTGSGGSATGGTTTPGTGGAVSPGSGGSGTGGAASGGAAGGRSGTGGAASGGAAGGGAGTGGAAGGPPIVDLFNGTDLTGWIANREPPAANQSATPGTVLSTAEALQIFKVENGTIRVYGDAAATVRQYRHSLITSRSYSRYNFWLEYKWGTKTFPPYANVTTYPRDAGILFNVHGDLTQVWPSSVEFQVKDGTVGDIFALLARCTSLAAGGTGTSFVDTTAGGTMKVINGSGGNARHMRAAGLTNLEIPNDWNSVQLQADAGAAVFIVNGRVVNKVLGSMTSSGAAVTAGPIALQAEHAEVFYRNIRIQVLP